MTHINPPPIPRYPKGVTPDLAIYLLSKKRPTTDARAKKVLAYKKKQKKKKNGSEIIIIIRPLIIPFYFSPRSLSPLFSPFARAGVSRVVGRAAARWAQRGRRRGERRRRRESRRPWESFWYFGRRHITYTGPERRYPRLKANIEREPPQRTSS